jgi:localization factor PodJL
MNFRGDDRPRRNAGPDRPRGERDDHHNSSDGPVQREGGPDRDQRGQGSPHRHQEERAERQRRERQRFEQAAASAMAKQRRDDSIDKAVAEITARQQMLDGDIAAEITAPPRPREGEAAAAPPFGERPSAPPGPPPAPEPERVFAAWPGGWRSQNSPEAPVDISGLEEQLRQMTARIEALRPSSELETAIAGLRTELAEIGRSFTEALPRRALESIEIEVKALGQRLDHSRQAGVDAAALAGIERGLAEVHKALSGLTPAEGLVGFDEAVKALGQKIDAIVSRDDAGALQQLEAAIGSLRGIVSHVASNDALNKVAEDVRALSAKVDGLASIGPNTPTLVALENRIDILASALNASTEAGHAVPRELEKLLSSLIEKLERAQLTNADHAALVHLEDRIAALVKRLDASDARFGLLEGVERGLADLLVYIDQLRDNAVVGPKTPVAAGAIEPEFAEVKPSERRRAKASEAAIEEIQGPVGPVVDRLAAIESDTWTDRPKAVATEPMPSPMPAPAPPPLPVHESETEAMAAYAVISEPTPRLSLSESVPQRPAATRKPIDPSLPPDHPLEPGSTGRSRSSPSVAERIAASEAAAGSKPPVIPDPGGGKPDFIAAARRAAQAAAAASPEGKRLARSSAEGPAQPKKFTERVRMLAVAAAVVVIVVGGFHIISRLFEDGGSNAPAPAQTEPPRGQSTPQVQTEPPRTQSAPPQVRPEPPARKEPPHVEAEPMPPTNSANLPTPAPLPGTDSLPTSGAEPSAPSDPNAGQQSQLNSAVGPTATALGPHSGDGKSGGRPATGSAAGVPMDITGSLPNGLSPNASSPNASSPNAASPNASSPRSTATTPMAGDKLPAAIGGPALRVAALAGDPLAAYEVGVRFSEGRVVPANNEEAARWFEIAAKKAIVPAQFRLGTLYEKGLGVKRNLAAARDLYRAAADKGHGKAMHNLAVLYAEGADGKPDYNAAALWFRKAADHGITDSQYNLAILYARGVGVEQNLAESYKWFFLAAKEGDQDAAQKRDEIASRLDQQTLAAARAAAEHWTAVPQPADAITVKGTWDAPANGPPAAKPKPRSAKAPTPDATRVN